MNRIKVVITLLVSIAFVLQSCCEPCEKPDLGQFPLSQASVDKMVFSFPVPRNFVSTNGDVKTLTYLEPIQGFEESTYNCEFDRRCGVCCSNLEAGFFFSQLVDNENTIRFEFALIKDFRNNTPEEPNDSISELLTLSYNSAEITGEIPDVANASLESDIELDGRTFSNVQVFENPLPGLSTSPNAIRRFYFSFTEGIVGYQTEDGTIWRIE